MSQSKQPSPWLKDFLASIVVFLVALPLCMGIAIASGVPPALGLITGIVGGIVVGLIAGAPLQVSGPAAGLAVLVYELVQDHGVEALGPVLLIAGAVQLVCGAAKLGRWFRAISPSVIHGMLAGIGVLIFASQFHVMLDDSPRGNGIVNLLSIPEALIEGIVPLDGSTHHLAAGIGLLTIVSLLLWNRFKPASLKMIPAALVAVVIASVVAGLQQLPIRFVEVPENLLDAANWVPFGELASYASGEFLLLGIVFAFVASAETLLCATAVDQMHSGPRTNYDRELAAQGVGNLLCGVAGALPMTGVIVRSSANVDAGAVSRRSTIMHGIWLLALVSAFPWLLTRIPTSSLAAILVYTGYKLVNVGRIKRINDFGKAETAIYFATLIGIVATDLLTGVLIGFGLAIAKLAYTFSHIGTRLEVEDGRADLYLEGSATFLGLPRLAQALETVPPGKELHIHIDRLSYVDHACLELMESFREQHKATGGTVKIEWQELLGRYHRVDEALSAPNRGGAGEARAREASPIER